MIINTKNVEIKELSFIEKEGKFLLKITEFKDDGFTTNGDQKFKLFFEGVEFGTKEPKYLHSESFNVGAKSLYRIKMLEIAIKAPEIYNINDFIGRYVVANIVKSSYTKRDGSVGIMHKVKNWEYSQFNDKMPPIPEAKEIEDDDLGIGIVDISDEESPF